MLKKEHQAAELVKKKDRSQTASAHICVFLYRKPINMGKNYKSIQGQRRANKRRVKHLFEGRV